MIAAKEICFVGRAGLEFPVGDTDYCLSEDR